MNQQYKNMLKIRRNSEEEAPIIACYPAVPKCLITVLPQNNLNLVRTMNIKFTFSIFAWRFSACLLRTQGSRVFLEGVIDLSERTTFEARQEKKQLIKPVYCPSRGRGQFLGFPLKHTREPVSHN